MQKTEFEVPNWDEIYALLLELADKIRISSFKPDLIVGIARGGWVPARILSDIFDNSNLANIKVEFYSGIYETKKSPMITQPLSTPVKNKLVLLIDDIVDTGESLRLVYNLLIKDAQKVRTAVIFYKPWSVYKPDYYSKNTTAWVIFPWERFEATRLIVKKMLSEGKKWSEIEEQLTKLKVAGSLIKKLINYSSEG